MASRIERPARLEPAVVVTGPESLLVSRAADEATERLCAQYPDRSVRVLDCARKSDAGVDLAQEIAQASAPSLFGDPPILRVENIDQSDDAVQQVLKDLLADPGGTAIVITHGGAARGRGVINAAGKTDATVVKCARPKEREVRAMARDEAKAAGGTITDQAEQWLLDAVGTDSLELLLAAVRQAVADTPGGRVDVDTVHAMFPVQGKVSSFTLVDHVWAGRTTEALRLLRTMEQRERGVGVSVVAALAHGVRMMALAGMRGAQPPRDLAIAPWQADRARDNARRWGATGAKLAGVSARLPRWDADMKGGLDGGVALDDEQKMAIIESVVARLSGGAAD
ncbi:MAG: hypothetical protein U0R64_03735 [Candidatus Nanopelagicales bacterium]